MPHFLGELAAKVGGDLVGDATLPILDVAPLQSATPTDLSFLANAKYRDAALKSQAGAILVAEPLGGFPGAQVVCTDPYLALARIATHLHPPRSFDPGVSPRACVDPSAEVHPGASIQSGAVVEAGAQVKDGAVIGANCVIGVQARVGIGAVMHPGSKLLDRCVLGDRAILQAGAVVGSDGFGYAPDAAGQRTKIPQVGIVVIEEDVEVGANCTVDRATFGKTVIGRGTKIDNLVQIAHNVRTGENCVIVAQSGVAGSTTLGNRVVMGAQTGSVGHIHIGDDVTLAARAAATESLSQGTYGGAPALPHRDWLRVTVSLPKVPELRRRLRQLESKVEALLNVGER